MAFNLRKRTPISYYEPEEPSFDDYLYCELCADFVYEYCAIHGPLLVVPDNKVPVKTNFPSFVPRAALTIPHVFLHLAPSIIPGAGLGVFSSLTLPRGVQFGPYRGQCTQEVDSMYCWQIYDRNNKPSHVVDAVDGNQSNWMRYVNCARHWREQNLLAYQYRGQLYYRTIKIIPRFTELMVFYGSEYANALHIDLSKYNYDKYYEKNFNKTVAYKEKMDNDVTKNHPSTVSTENIHNEEDNIKEAYISIDNFKFIDDKDDQPNDANENSRSSLIDTNKANINTTLNIEPLHVEFNGDKVTLKFNTDETIFQCETCQKTFKKPRSLRDHKLRHLRKFEYECQHCNFQTDSMQRFDEHVEKHTNTFLYSCEFCFFKTNVKKNFKRHTLCHSSSGVGKQRSFYSTPKKCDLCDFETCSRKSLQTHKSKHIGNIYKCHLCQYSIYSKCNLTRHIANKHKNSI